MLVGVLDQIEEAGWRATGFGAAVTEWEPELLLAAFEAWSARLIPHGYYRRS